MPELPEVETVCRGIATKILNKKIVAINIRNPKLRHPIRKSLIKTLPKQTIININRRGKYILIKTKTGTLIIHLGMSGTLQTKPKDHPIAKHDHFIINFNNKLDLRYNDPRRFGVILWTKKDPLKHKLLKDLGVEPFAKRLTAKYLWQRSESRRCRVKQFIMDNHVVVGIGNIYANEVLFATKTDPLQKANTVTLDQYKKIITETRKILKLAIKHGGTTIRDHTDSSGKEGSFQKKLKVYGRQNQPCCKCKTGLTTIRIGGRATVFCPKCQKDGSLNKHTPCSRKL